MSSDIDTSELERDLRPEVSLADHAGALKEAREDMQRRLDEADREAREGYQRKMLEIEMNFQREAAHFVNALKARATTASEAAFNQLTLELRDVDRLRKQIR